MDTCRVDLENHIVIHNFTTISAEALMMRKKRTQNMFTFLST